MRHVTQDDCQLSLICPSQDSSPAYEKHGLTFTIRLIGVAFLWTQAPTATSNALARSFGGGGLSVAVRSRTR